MDDLAIRLQKAAADHCAHLDLPHDLGLRLAEVVSQSDGLAPNECINTAQELRDRLAAYDKILSLRGSPGPCACMGPQADDAFCPCKILALTEKTLRQERDITLWALARYGGKNDSAD